MENVEISRKKNADYANAEDAFLNFRACTMMGIDPKVGLLVRMSDKLVRASNLLTHEANVVDEQIGDTLADLANYAMILKLFIEDEKQRVSVFHHGAGGGGSQPGIVVTAIGGASSHQGSGKA